MLSDIFLISTPLRQSYVIVVLALLANLTTSWLKNYIFDYFKENFCLKYLTTSKILNSKSRDLILVPEDPSYWVEQYTIRRKALLCDFGG